MAGALKCMVQSSANAVSGVTSYWLGLDSTATANTLTLNTTQGNCDILDIRGIRTMAVKPVSGGVAISSLTFYGCDTYNGTFVLIDSIGANGVQTVTDSVWNVVDLNKLAPHAFIQMKPNNNGTGVVVAKN